MDSANKWLGNFSSAGTILHALPPKHGNAEPLKLENFLWLLQEPTASNATVRRTFGSGGASTFGLSMVKNWLHSQPAPPAGSGDPMAAMVVTLLERGGSTVAASGGGGAVVEAAQQKKAEVETLWQQTSVYRGVTKHRWTERYEAHLWDNSCRREGQCCKGRQVYLGGYDKEDKAARAYDLAALILGHNNKKFSVSEYKTRLEEMKHMTRQQYVAFLRRKSSGFSCGASIYRGVTRHRQHGRWQARTGRVAGNTDLYMYLGIFSTQEEAAEAYDIAAIKFHDINAVTNFDMSRYDVKSIIESRIPICDGKNKRMKDVPEHCDMGFVQNSNNASHFVGSNLPTDSIGSYDAQHDTYGGWAPITYSHGTPVFGASKGAEWRHGCSSTQPAKPPTFSYHWQHRQPFPVTSCS